MAIEVTEERPGTGLFASCRPHACCESEIVFDNALCCEAREDDGCVVGRGWVVPADEPQRSSEIVTTVGHTESETKGDREDTQKPPPLYVPPIFDKLHLSEVVAAADVRPDHPEQAKRPEEEEQRRICQTVVRAFVRSMLRGVLVSLVLDDGGSLPTLCSLDRRLEHFELQAKGGPQVVLPFRDIAMVCTQDEMHAVSGAIPGGATLDACCVALMLSGRRFLALRFGAPRTREYFEVSLGVLMAARGSPREPRAPPVAAELAPLAARLLSSSAGGLPPIHHA